MPSTKKSAGNPHLVQLRKRIAKAPQSPGIYRWLDKNGAILYIGKAKNLRSRMKSYLPPVDSAKEGTQKEDKTMGLSAEAQMAQTGPWRLSMRKQLADFDVTITNSELEALILETNLIKENKPKYNVLMKDDKSYLYVQISREPYPIIDIVRRGTAPNTTGFGPFIGTDNIRKTMDMLHTVFPYKTCKKSLEALNRSIKKGEDPTKVFTKDSQPCLEFQIGECCGLCKGTLSQKEYNNIIENISDFLKGKRKTAIEKLTEKMQQAASDKKFEKAASFRNTLQSIERMELQIVSDTSDEDTDIFGMVVVNGKALVVLFKVRGGKLIDELSLALAGEAENVSQALSQFIPQYYSTTPDIPDVIVVGEELEEHKLLQKWLEDKRKKKVELRIPERGKKSKLLILAEKNAQEKMKQMETKWETAAANIETALEELEKTLQLAEKPKRIECYDISHLGGTETVGSMVVAKNGKAANDQYRSFTIRTLKDGEVDDYKALNEVLSRRLKYLTQNIKEEEKKWKDEGIKLGRARKKETTIIRDIIRNDDNLSFEHIHEKDFIVARLEDHIIGCARIFPHKDGTKEFMSLWIHKDYRGRKLGQLLCRKILSREKNGKIYALLRSNLAEYYGEIGFQFIHDGPKSIGKVPKGWIIMMYSVKEHRDDKSLNTKPDLLVIDGGKGQVSTVASVLKKLELDIPVIGLAKREEEVFTPNAQRPTPFPKDSQAKFLLMRLRNEAHRFANKLREKKGTKSAIHSALDDVPGIGEKTKKELLERFGSAEGVREASDEELLCILDNTQFANLKATLTDNC
ncbi:excinuclease ABC subunit UvrC [Patescibacteria group bacterium]|nr:excinuclease ABC subunit UvrC [Patescibacteria group bacterium]